VAKRQKAVFTCIHNEPVFTPIWIKYYSQFYESQDIYILHLIKPMLVDFDSWLPSQPGFVRVPIQDRDYCDFNLALEYVHNFQRELLGRYDCVLYTDIDEIVCHEAGLAAYIDEWLRSGRGDVESCKGYELVHSFDEESPIDLSLPILGQRRWWYPCHLYDKPLLTRIPLDYCWGFHHCRQVPWETTDPNLLLIHLNKMDYEICRARKLARLQNESDSEISKEHPVGSPGWHHFVKEYEIKNWFLINVDNGGYYEKTLIPEHIRRFPL
jgi:hypothetical protein